MPSKLKRVALNLPPDVEAAVTDFAQATGKPVATVIVDFLREMVPQFEALAKMQRQILSGKTSAAKQTLRHMMGDQMAAVLQEAQPELFAKPKAKRK
jgi:hypothetical protein